MLIVQSDDPPVKRIKANELSKKLKALQDDCKRSSSYCTDPCPDQGDQVSRKELYDPVKAKLNKVAMDTLGSGDRFERLAEHSGRSRNAFPQKGDPGPS